jgi:hypothetical protein
VTSLSNEWWRARRQRLVNDFGGRCIGCGTESDLQFAHTRPTALNGRGRGQNHRVRDVLNNPAAYVLLCQSCHRVFDDAGSLRPAASGF